MGFILGSDLLHSIGKWQHAEKLISEFHFLVVPRPGYEDMEMPANFVWLTHAHLTLTSTLLSSSEIRKRLQMDVYTVDGLIPSAVLGHIIRYSLYGCSPAPKVLSPRL